ncbi:YggT family protein [Erythromicrobium ramosum]|jgi:YggT family protein|uniref:YggT family protein n=1 Tax=Erythrobacter ramosus TaxID=35811 RepID=A0A6I4UJB7_9SPHN|nr:YggT family protein [Erythrobacter ramosus]MBB3774435.1 YggT family protein [Erythrobacter ramosus]MXP37914.1 YggT family protein [Erythrobacter ramosus]
MTDALFQILSMIISTANMLLIIWFIIGLLFAFNVVSPSNQFAYAVHDALSRLFEPALRPIRKVMPDTGAIDFSPMVFLMILNAVGYILQGAVR